MPVEYNVFTVAGELPTTKTYTKPGQRLYYLRAPGVLQWDADGRPVHFCLFDVDILQQKGNKVDQEGYHVTELPEVDVRNLPRDQYGRPAMGGYLFECFTCEPTAERPGVYKVATGADGRAYWCECLGAKGHKQYSQCKHRDTITHLAEQSSPDRPAQSETSGVRQAT